MAKSAFTDAHRILVEVLTEARKSRGLTQVELAVRLKKDQTLISNIERGHRRIDVLEFYAVARALGADPVELYGEVVRRLPVTILI
jgi:transcriptional regulator with XRE-family HTH domain